MKKLAYVSRQYIEQQYFVKGLEKYFEVQEFRHWHEIKDPNSFNTIMVETDWGVLTRKIKHKNIIVLTKGVDIYVGKYNDADWNNVNWYFTLSQHQLDYFKVRWGKHSPKNTGVVPVIAPLKHFGLRKNPVENNKVALIANITDRKGTYQIPDFLLRFPNLAIHHLGSVEAYGDPVREYVRWRLERDKTSHRYLWKKKIPMDKVDEWLEDKTMLSFPICLINRNSEIIWYYCFKIINH